MFARALLTGLAALALLAGPAAPGAWERPPGKSFVALAYDIPLDGAPLEGTGSFYLEHGLPHRLTIGAKLDQRPIGPHEFEVFLRRNVIPADGPLQMAIEIGISFRLDGYIEPLTGTPVPLADWGRPTLALHLGRGFTTPLGNGWWDVRAGLDLPGGDGAEGDTPAVFELDVTLGTALTERSFAMLQVWHDSEYERSRTSVVPGVGWRVTDRLTTVASYVRNTKGGEADTVELAIWLEF